MPNIVVTLKVPSSCKNCQFCFNPMEVGMSWDRCSIFNETCPSSGRLRKCIDSTTKSSANLQKLRDRINKN